MRKLGKLGLVLSLFFMCTLLVNTMSGNAATSTTKLQHNVRNALQTKITVLLPQQLPTKKMKFISAKTTSTSNKYKVVYYGLDTPSQVNSKKVLHAKKEDAILRIKAKKYDSKNLASKKMKSEYQYNKAGKKVEYISGIIAYQDAGAGSLWTTWKKGKWTFVTKTTTKQSATELNFVKQSMLYLKTQVLPIPTDTGIMLLIQKNGGTIIKWQNENIIYELDYTNKAMDALKAVTSLSSK